MKTSIRVITAATICLAAQNSLAYITFGAPDCGQWLTEKTQARRTWLLGFLSGMNAAHTASKNFKVDPLDQLSSGEQAYVWMDNYCKKNPLNDLSAGGIDLYIELMDREAKAKARK